MVTRYLDLVGGISYALLGARRGAVFVLHFLYRLLAPEASKSLNCVGILTLPWVQRMSRFGPHPLTLTIHPMPPKEAQMRLIEGYPELIWASFWVGGAWLGGSARLFDPEGQGTLLLLRN